MRRAALAIALALLAACPGGSGSSGAKIDEPNVTNAGSSDVTKTPDAGDRFVRGPAVTPADKLVAWFEQQKRGSEPRLVRVPLVLAKAGPGFATRGATIGSGAGALSVYANDAALGIGLADRARRECKGATACAMWVEGYWRGKQDGDYTFDVMTVVRTIPADALAQASYVEVEGESGN